MFHLIINAFKLYLFCVRKRHDDLPPTQVRPSSRVGNERIKQECRNIETLNIDDLTPIVSCPSYQSLLCMTSIIENQTAQIFQDINGSRKGAVITTKRVTEDKPKKSRKILEKLTLRYKNEPKMSELSRPHHQIKLTDI